MEWENKWESETVEILKFDCQTNSSTFFLGEKAEVHESQGSCNQSSFMCIYTYILILEC